VLRYRLIFEGPEGLADHYGGELGSARIQSDRLYEVGDIVEHEGKRWVVTSAPLNQPALGAEADLRVWPADAEGPRSSEN
jgi:hypothetical protein